MANSTIAKNSLQFVKEWTYPRRISSRTKSEGSVLLFVSGWSNVDIFKRVPSVLNTERQNSAVNRGYRSDTSSQGNPWSRKNVSIETQAQFDTLIHLYQLPNVPSCWIWQRTQQKQYSSVYRRGNRGRSPLRRIHSTQSGQADDARGRREGIGFTCWQTSRVRTYLRRDWYCEVSISFGSPWDMFFHDHDVHQRMRRGINTWFVAADHHDLERRHGECCRPQLNISVSRCKPYIYLLRIYIMPTAGWGSSKNVARDDL